MSPTLKLLIAIFGLLWSVPALLEEEERNTTGHVAVFWVSLLYILSQVLL